MEEYHIQNPLFEYDTDKETTVKNIMKKIEIESMEKMKIINTIKYDTDKDYFKEIDNILENGRKEFFRAIGRKMTFKEEKQTFG
jgi:hypothetical protein